MKTATVCRYIISFNGVITALATCDPGRQRVAVYEEDVARCIFAVVLRVIQKIRDQGRAGRTVDEVFNRRGW
jgi:hypothetical protein